MVGCTRWQSHSAFAGLRLVWPAILVLSVLTISFQRAEARPSFSAIAVDASTGKILFSRDPDSITHPASLTKVMTLYILFGELKAGKVKLGTQIKVSRAASAKAPSKLGLRPGETISVEDAIKAIVTRSANDVAATIAENLAPSEAAFATRMTSVAHDLGMSRTVFHNASGLPDPRQVTTARDIATLSLRIQRDFPEYYPYFRTMAFSYRGQVIRTHNRLLGRYTGADGIKTGYVAASGFNLTSSAKRGDKRVVGVVMGATSATSRDLYMMAMLDKAFPNCRDGTAVAIAVEGVKPKAREPEIKLAGSKLAETQEAEAKLVQAKVAEVKATSMVPKRPKAKLKEAEAKPKPDTQPKEPQAAPVLAASADENAAEEQGGDESGSIDKPIETAAKEIQAGPEPRSDLPANQTILSKSSPDGTPLPFAIKKPGADVGGVVVVAAADPSWHIQIGAYPTKKDAQAVLYKLKSLDLDLFDDKAAVTVEVQKGKETLYRARFSGFTEENARAACDRLTKQGFGCVPMQPQS